MLFDSFSILYNRPSKVILIPGEAASSSPVSPAPVIISAVTETEDNGGESVTVTGDEEIIRGSGHTVNTQPPPDTALFLTTKSSWQSQEEVITSRSLHSRWGYECNELLLRLFLHIDGNNISHANSK